MSKALDMQLMSVTPADPKQASQLLLCFKKQVTDKAKEEAGSPTREDSMEPLEQNQVSQARETVGSPEEVWAAGRCSTRWESQGQLPKARVWGDIGAAL